MKWLWSGFTLIETLIVLGLSLLLTTVGILVYRDSYNHKIVKLVAQGWARQLQLFEKKTESGSIVNEFNGCRGAFDGLIVTTQAGHDIYTLRLKCSRANSSIKSYNLEDFGSRKKVIFKDNLDFELFSLTKGVNQEVNVKFCLENTNNCWYQVNLKKNGEVQIQSL